PLRLLVALRPPPPPGGRPRRGAGLTPPAGTAALSQRVAREVDEVASKQRQVWDSVASTQRKLSQGLNTPVASPQSASSLQLALENDRLKGAQAAFMAALQPAGEKEADVVGYVVAINGRMNSANLYPSNALFRKMWGKQLAAAVTEAIGEGPGAVPTATSPPAPAAATQFLAEAEKGKTYQRPVAAGSLQEIRDADKFLYNEARAADGQWIHRNYLAK